MSGPKKLGWLAGGDAAWVAGRARWWGLGSPQWGQWVRRCAAPRQTQWSWLQGRAVCGSRWRTERGHAVGVCAVPVVLVCAVPVLCLVDGV